MRKSTEGTIKSRSASIRGYMPREEMLQRTDEMREKTFEILTKDQTTNVRLLSKQLNVHFDAARSYADYLVKINAATKYRQGLDTFYVATGKPYVRAVRKTFGKESMKNPNPHGRIIRLLDRKPDEVSKDEHLAARKKNHVTYQRSSMGMFDGH